MGSQSKAEESEPPSATAKAPVGRDLAAKPTKGNRGRFGATGRGGRICGPSTGPGTMEKYLEREKVFRSTRGASSDGTLSKGQEGKTRTTREEIYHSAGQGERGNKGEPSKTGDGGDPGSTPTTKSQLNRAEDSSTKAETSDGSQGT